MDRFYFLSIFTVFTLLISTSSALQECTWGQAIHDALQARDLMVVNLNKHRQSPTLERAVNFMESLYELYFQIDGLGYLDLSLRESNEQLISVLLKQPKKPIVKHLLAFNHHTLEEDYEKRGLGIMVQTFQDYQNFLCVNALYSTLSHSFEGYELPLDLMCDPIKNELGTKTKLRSEKLNTEKVCKSALECFWATNKAHTFWINQGPDISTACNKPGKSCDIGEAVPIMVSLLWYRVSYVIAQSLCHNLPQHDLQSSIKTEIDNIKAMASEVRAYFSTLTWDLFLTQATIVGAFSEVEKAMIILKQHEKSLYSSIKACNSLQAQDVCIIKRIYAEYKALQKMKRKRREKTRDLRLFPRVNHAKLVELRKKTLKEIEALAVLLKAKSESRTANTLISEYFKGVSRYDERISDQDFGYVKAKLTEFKVRADKLTTELDSQIKEVLVTANSALVLDELVNIADAFNPLNLFDTDKHYGIAVNIMTKAAQIAKGSMALFALADVASDTEKLARDFQCNTDQMRSMKDIMDKIKANDKEGVNELADAFIEAYGNYNPQVSQSRLAKNDELWGTFKELACELLFEKVGAGGKALVIGKAKKLLCEKLDGTIAQLGTLRGNIFDFQFELVDIIAKIVRGNIGTGSTYKSQASHYNYHITSKKELFLGFLKAQTQLQTEASSYCDKVEYMNEGQPIEVCKKKGGLFSEADLDELAAYNPEVSYHLDERFVYIPTQAQFPGDRGFIDLTRLTTDGSVLFQPPFNKTWLKQFNWLAAGETKAPFVESFKVYLPRKTYPSRGEHQSYLKTQVTLTAEASCKVDISSDVMYDLPLENTRYVTRYVEGYPRCPGGREINNPYSLCKNLPGICDSTQRIPGRGMMPTILTTWKLTYNMRSGRNNAAHTWNAPNPATNLLIIAKLKLRYLPNTLLTKRDTLPVKRSVLPPLGCCPSDQYRPKWNDKTCEACPIEFQSISMLRGYYCEMPSN